MQGPDGFFTPLSEEEANVLRRIAEAGHREIPIFRVGEVLSFWGGNFRVIAVDGHLLVLSGISREEALRESVQTKDSRG